MALKLNETSEFEVLPKVTIKWLSSWTYCRVIISQPRCLMQQVHLKFCTRVPLYTTLSTRRH